MFEKETSPAIERVPISPPHLLRIVALSRQPDLHGECTYGRLSRTSYEKRGLAASQAFPPKKKERERERGGKKGRKREEEGRTRARARVYACVLFIANSIHTDELHRNAPPIVRPPLDLDSHPVQVNLPRRSFYWKRVRITPMAFRSFHASFGVDHRLRGNKMGSV